MKKILALLLMVALLLPVLCGCQSDTATLQPTPWSRFVSIFQ